MICRSEVCELLPAQTGLNASNVESVTQTAVINPSCRPRTLVFPASAPVELQVSTHRYGVIPAERAK